MTFTHALSTNRYGEGDLIVSTSAANGTHITLASAMAAAVSGQTIFLRDSVTENVTLTAGVNISAWTGGRLNTPTITGTLTMTAAGTCNINGVRLQTNSAFLLAVTGSANSIVNVRNCFLNITNNTGVSYTSSGTGSAVIFSNCEGDVGTTGIAIFSASGAGSINFNNCVIGNSGGSSTASTVSAGTLGMFWSAVNSPITTSGTGGISCYLSTLNAAGTNSTALTHGGSGAANECALSWISGGTASAISIGASLGVHSCEVVSSNTNAITGAGTLIYTDIYMGNTSTAMNVTTNTQRPSFSGGISFDQGTNLLNVYTVGTWTPTLAGSAVAGTSTYTNQNGYYTKIGNMVTIWGLVTTSAATGTGDVNLGGLPFTIKNQTNGNAHGTMAIGGAATIPYPAARTWGEALGAANTVILKTTCHGTAVIDANLQMANTTLNFQPTISYQV